LGNPFFLVVYGCIASEIQKQGVKMSYQDALSTKLLATHCVCCGLPLVDAKSVELGIGPECRSKSGITSDIDEDVRVKANELVYTASIEAQNGAVEKVLNISEEIRSLGLGVLADKVARRFKKGAIKASVKADIEIDEDGDVLIVKTPYRRGDAKAFVDAWRNINGRRYDRENRCNRIPKSEREALWNLLREFFPNKWGRGPKGVFKVPASKVEKTEKVEVVEESEQLEFDWKEESRQEQEWEANNGYR
jgi:hypothetical protein